MSLNDIKLPEILIRELYKDALIGSPASSVAPAVSAPSQSPSRESAPVTTSPANPAPTPPASGKPMPAATTHTPAEPAPATSIPSPTSEPYKYLGGNRRRMTIIVQSPGTAFLPDDQLSFLTKILEACRMNIGDVAILNHATTPVIIPELRRQLQPSTILLFGLEPTAIRLPITFPHFKIQSYDQCSYLCAPPLKDLVGADNESKLLKSKLWVCLKQLFEL